MTKSKNRSDGPMTSMKLHDEVPSEEQAEIDARLAAYQATHSEDEIDTSDIPDLDDEFWERATSGWNPPRKTHLSLRLDNEVVDFFKQRGRGYQSRINAVLRAYVERQKKAEKIK